MNVWNYDSIWVPPIDAEGLVTQWRLDSKGGGLFVCFTEEKQESQKRWSTAILLPDSPSPVSDKPCLLCWGAGGLHWWQPHVWHLCHLRRQRWLVFHSALNSPVIQRENQSRDLKYTSVTWPIQCQEKLFHDDRIYEKKFWLKKLKLAYNVVKIFIVPYIVIHYIFIINNCNHHGKKY